MTSFEIGFVIPLLLWRFYVPRYDKAHLKSQKPSPPSLMAVHLWCCFWTVLLSSWCTFCFTICVLIYLRPSTDSYLVNSNSCFKPNILFLQFHLNKQSWSFSRLKKKKSSFFDCLKNWGPTPNCSKAPFFRSQLGPLSFELKWNHLDLEKNEILRISSHLQYFPNN